MSKAASVAALPSGAVFGPVVPVGRGPTSARVFESWGVDEDSPTELIGGWVLRMAPGNLESGQASGDLYAELRAFARSRRWTLSFDTRHRLPWPPNTVVYPDLAIHTVKKLAYLPHTESIGRVPDLVVEILSHRTCERDTAPDGAKFLTYQTSGVREYYYSWPDGRDASGFVLQRGVYKPLPRDRKGFFRSPLLGRSLRLVPPALRPA